MKRAVLMVWNVVLVEMVKSVQTGIIVESGLVNWLIC